jgi:uncharacterized protein (TIGR03435 family)
LLSVCGDRVLSQAQQAEELRFEVLSVKPTENPVPARINNAGSFFVTLSLRWLLRNAFRIQDYQMQGVLPNWTDSERFEIDGKTNRAFANGEVALLFRTVLIDRFSLKTHTDQKKLPAYNLVVAKNGPLMKSVPRPESPTVQTITGRLRGLGGNMNQLAGILSSILQADVANKTNLDGFYDFNMQWTIEDPLRGAATTPAAATPPELGAVSLFSAIQEQLGLRLEGEERLVDVIVIEKVERPTPN